MDKVKKKDLEVLYGLSGVSRIYYKDKEIGVLILPSNDKKSNIDFMENLISEYRRLMNQDIDREGKLGILF